MLSLLSTRLARSTLFLTYCPCLLELMMIPMPACKRKYSKRLSYLQNNWMFRMVKQVVLPRVHGLALKTTVAAVRVNALLCFSDMVHIVDKKSVLDILQTIHQCTAVDHSSPTLMCTLGVANSILKQFGIEFVAEYILPLLIPLLITQQLNVQQFAKYMLFVKDALRKIEEKRGVTLTDAGVSEVRTLPAFEGRPSGQMNKSASNIPSIPKRSSSWDEDWLPARVAPTAIQSITTTSKTQPSVQSQPVQVNSRYSRSSTSSIASTQEPPSSCPAVDVEWPPQSLSGVTIQLGDIEKLDVNKGASPNSTLDTIDPFANWPPRPSGTSSVLSSLNNGTTASTANDYGLSNSATTNGLSIQSASWASSLQSSSEFER
ncbi:SCY1-like protein 2 B isoform X2 [Primulina tabacum]|uniref:SCY1-like protein 2 B isoform X2 n=1 Tax=Primulina tabacum TaxID=48773 RepID=UPI003F598079